MTLTVPVSGSSISTSAFGIPVAEGFNWDTFLSMSGCSVGTSSTTYVDITGASKSWTKLGSASQTDILFHASASGFISTSAPTFWVLGVNINGVDTDLSSFQFTGVNTRGAIPATWVRIPGVPAGPYTVKLRGKRGTGTGSINMDAGDTVSFLIGERPL